MDQQIIAKMHALLQEAYEAGRRDGGTAMRDAILKAAEAPVSKPSQPKLALDDARNPAARAPRGSLPKVMARALTANPGATENELQAAIANIDPRISPRSVGGQLRRFRGKFYRQEGRRWFLMAQASAGSISEPADNPN